MVIRTGGYLLRSPPRGSVEKVVLGGAHVPVERVHGCHVRLRRGVLGDLGSIDEREEGGVGVEGRVGRESSKGIALPSPPGSSSSRLVHVCSVSDSHFFPPLYRYGATGSDLFTISLFS